jgi:hypothetical protein
MQQTVLNAIVSKPYTQCTANEQLRKCKLAKFLEITGLAFWHHVIGIGTASFLYDCLKVTHLQAG